MAVQPQRDWVFFIVAGVVLRDGGSTVKLLFLRGGSDDVFFAARPVRSVCPVRFALGWGLLGAKGERIISSPALQAFAVLLARPATAAAVRRFCLLSFGSCGWVAFFVEAPIPDAGGMSFAFSSFAKRGESFSPAVGLDVGSSVTAADVFSGRQLLGLRCVMLVLSGRW